MLEKISSMLDAVADSLEKKGLVKEAFEIDKIADMIDISNDIISKLQAAARKMDPYYNPDNGWFSGESETDEGKPEWNHWTGALDELKKKISVGDPEVTLLSLSLNYGPTPLLSKDVAEAAFKKLWPKGNPKGWALDPKKVLKEIRTL